MTYETGTYETKPLAMTEGAVFTPVSTVRHRAGSPVKI